MNERSHRSDDGCQARIAWPDGAADRPFKRIAGPQQGQPSGAIQKRASAVIGIAMPALSGHGNRSPDIGISIVRPN